MVDLVVANKGVMIVHLGLEWKVYAKADGKEDSQKAERKSEGTTRSQVHSYDTTNTSTYTSIRLIYPHKYITLSFLLNYWDSLNIRGEI